MKIVSKLFLFVILIEAISCSFHEKRRISVDIRKDYSICIPDVKKEIPTPLEKNDLSTNFKFRGIKGYGWDVEQYMEEIPYLAKFKMNFLMNCYLSLNDAKNSEWYDLAVYDTARLRSCNKWREPLPIEKKEGFEKIVKMCKEYGINFCFSINPNLNSKKPFKYESSEDFEILFQYFKWMQNLGVKWFNISLDDISSEIDARGQAGMVNKILNRLRIKDKDVNMIFTPTHYIGTLDNDNYTNILAKELDKNVYVFWVGMQGVPARIKKSDAEKYKKNIAHRLFIWDNYPVNDAGYTLHLGPITGRDPGLCDIADGYMANAMCRENMIERIPILTMADYAYNPQAYNPETSIGQAILQLSKNKEQINILKELVEIYPDCLRYDNISTWYNPMIANFKIVLNFSQNKNKPLKYINYIEGLYKRFYINFPEFTDVSETFKNNSETLRRLYNEKYSAIPVKN